MNGFAYDRINGGATVEPKIRLAWLRRVDHWQGQFLPHPYTQLARNLAAAGHDRAARKVLRARQKSLAADHFAQDAKLYANLRNSGDQRQMGDMGKVWLRMYAARVWSALIRTVAGYGYVPERALYWAIALWGLSTVFNFVCYRLGAFVPNSDIIIASQAFADAVTKGPIGPGLIWGALPFASHYETFYAGAYALDVLLPIVDLSQGAHGRPRRSRGSVGARGPGPLALTLQAGSSPPSALPPSLASFRRTGADPSIHSDPNTHLPFWTPP